MSRGILPGTADRMSKYVTASRTGVGKGDCSPNKSPAVIAYTIYRGAKIIMKIRYADLPLN